MFGTTFLGSLESFGTYLFESLVEVFNVFRCRFGNRRHSACRDCFAGHDR